MKQIRLIIFKTRYESGNFAYKNILNAFFHIVKYEGPTNLYSGFLATVTRNMILSGIYFSIYTKIKSVLNTQKFNNNQSALYFASCALISTTISLMFTQPLDVVRTFMQLDPKIYKTFFGTVKSIYNQKGINGFMVGFYPRTLRRILISVFSWTVYEKATLKIV